MVGLVAAAIKPQFRRNLRDLANKVGHLYRKTFWPAQAFLFPEKMSTMKYAVCDQKRFEQVLSSVARLCKCLEDFYLARTERKRLDTPITTIGRNYCMSGVLGFDD